MYHLRRRGYDARALTIIFHGIANGELRAARSVAKAAGVMDHRFFEVPSLKEAANIRGSKFVGMPGTYIPMRNAIFYSIAASYAEEVGAGFIAGGHNKDDLRIFRDSSREFFSSMQDAFRKSSKILGDKRVRILMPLQKMTKPEVVRYGSQLGVPLGLTWSCHREGTTSCWECDGCRGRVRAFKIARIEDPLRRKNRAC